MAEDAVVNLAEHFARLHPGIRQSETVTPPQARIRANDLFLKILSGPLHFNEAEVLDGFRESKTNPVTKRRIVKMQSAPLLEGVDALADGLGRTSTQLLQKRCEL